MWHAVLKQTQFDHERTRPFHLLGDLHGWQQFWWIAACPLLDGDNRKRSFVQATGHMPQAVSVELIAANPLSDSRQAQLPSVAKVG